MTMTRWIGTAAIAACFGVGVWLGMPSKARACEPVVCVADGWEYPCSGCLGNDPWGGGGVGTICFKIDDDTHDCVSGAPSGYVHNHEFPCMYGGCVTGNPKPGQPL